MPRRRGFPPVLKRFGQHFLTDRDALTAIADAAQLGEHDIVVEIGAGRGALTELLLERAGRVIAVEIDRELASRLRSSHEGDPRLTVIEADILTLDYANIVSQPFSVLGNVPYYITTPILFHVLRPPLPVCAVLLVQEEVAQRIVAEPGSREYGALSVNVQAVARAEIVRSVPASAFSPPPKVESSVIRITPLETPLVPLDELEGFRAFVQSVFSVRRLSLADAARVLEGEGIDPRARPETLSPGQFASLLRAIS